MILLSLTNLIILLNLYPTLSCQLNLLVLSDLNTNNFTKIILQQSNWFLMGSYGSYPVVSYDESNNVLTTNCEICSIETWASGTSELLVNPMEREIGAIFISAFTLSDDCSEEVEAEISTYQENSSIDYCSDCGLSSDSGCDCFIGYAGYSCSTEIEEITTSDRQYNLAIGPNQWEFFYMHILDEDQLNFQISTSSNILMYLNPNNSTQNMPFMNHSLFTYQLIASEEDNTTEYEVYCGQYKMRYMLWSIYCMQNEVCNLILDFGSRGDSEFHELIIILVCSCVGVCICICGLFFAARILKKKILSRREGSSNPSIVYACEMDKLFPRHLYQTKDVSQGSCVICFTDISIGAECRELKCTHVFHTECIDQWVQVKQECPICKFHITMNQKKLFACR